MFNLTFHLVVTALHLLSYGILAGWEASALAKCAKEKHDDSSDEKEHSGSICLCHLFAYLGLTLAACPEIVLMVLVLYIEL